LIKEFLDLYDVREKYDKLSVILNELNIKLEDMKDENVIKDQDLIDLKEEIKEEIDNYLLNPDELEIYLKESLEGVKHMIENKT